MNINPAWKISPKRSDPGYATPVPLKKKKKRKNSISRIKKSSKGSQKVRPLGYSLPPETARIQIPGMVTSESISETWSFVGGRTGKTGPASEAGRTLPSPLGLSFSVSCSFVLPRLFRHHPSHLCGLALVSYPPFWSMVLFHPGPF